MKHSLPTAKRTSTRTKALVTGGLVALTVAGVGGAAFATFTGTTNAAQSVTSGTVTLSSIGGGAAGNRLSVAATNVAAGDTIQRTATMTNSGSLDLANIALTTTATTTSLLDSDPNGLTVAIDSCSVAWTESAFPYTYTCVGGTTSTVLASRAVIGSGIALSNLNLISGGSNNLRITLTLPSAAGNALQAKTSVIDFAFTATQRNATNR